MCYLSLVANDEHKLKYILLLRFFNHFSYCKLLTNKHTTKECADVDLKIYRYRSSKSLS
uniref:Uncharacterized protein n=1 Tax=Anguilla anguilla TaxID=7936 RepID=A0A0E9WCR7_ANGAN